MSALLDREDELKASLKLVREWMVAAGDRFWPQEQTLQDWLAAALVEGGYCGHATEIVAEVGLGEEENDLDGDLRSLINENPTPTSTFLYDLVVLKAAPRDAARSFTTARDPGMRLVIQVKALNSAGKMKTAALTRDLKSLWVAKEYEARRGRKLDVLMVVLATSCKEHDENSSPRRFAWLAETFEKFTGAPRAADVPGGIPIALVAREGEIQLKTTTGTWNPPA